MSGKGVRNLFLAELEPKLPWRPKKVPDPFFNSQLSMINIQ